MDVYSAATSGGKLRNLTVVNQWAAAIFCSPLTVVCICKHSAEGVTLCKAIQFYFTQLPKHRYITKWRQETQ